jgi:hypothetical protein
MLYRLMFIEFALFDSSMFNSATDCKKKTPTELFVVLVSVKSLKLALKPRPASTIVHLSVPI